MHCEIINSFPQRAKNEKALLDELLSNYGRPEAISQIEESSPVEVDLNVQLMSIVDVKNYGSDAIDVDILVRFMKRK